MVEKSGADGRPIGQMHLPADSLGLPSTKHSLARGHQSAALRRIQSLGLHVQRLAGERLTVEGDETTDVKRLAGSLDAVSPSLHILVALLAERALALRHDPH